MHSQGCADTWVTVSYNNLTLHWDLPWGDEVQKANMATSCERAGCCLPLCLKGKLRALSHPWDGCSLSQHS